MSELLNLVSRLKRDKRGRAGYVRAKLGALVPAQIRALRLKSDMPRQEDLAKASEMQQSRISMLETPGAANVTLETLAWLAGVFRVGLVVKFVPISEMLQWENTFSQDTFNVTKLEDDVDFYAPTTEYQEQETKLLPRAEFPIIQTTPLNRMNLSIQPGSVPLGAFPETDDSSIRPTPWNTEEAARSTQALLTGRT